MTTPLLHCPQIITVPVATPGDPAFQGACACCGWVADTPVDEPADALTDAYNHLARCEESWA